MKRLFHLLAVLVLSLPGLTQAAPDQVELSGLFKEGGDLFQQANALHDEDPAEARTLYQQAALRFERVVGEGGIHNGKIYYNIGNAYFRAGDLGRAILNYRRAAQYAPNDRNIEQNLAYARSQRLDQLAEVEFGGPLKALLFWHYDFSFGQRFALFALVFVGMWAAAATVLFIRRPFLKWIIGIGALGSVALGASLLVESWHLQNRRPGVVVAEEVVARKGDSASYEASFQEPLHAGAEFLVVEERPSWIQVELHLPDGERPRCWLPKSAVAMVR